MSYSDLFSSINCQRIVFFEDDFKQETLNKSRVLYDIARMEVNDRELFLSEVSAISSESEGKIRAFLESVDKIFDSIGIWRDVVVYGDITSISPIIDTLACENKTEIERLYTLISDEEVDSIKDIGAKYGIGLSRPIQYDPIFNDYVLFDNRAKSIRIYTDYSATTAKSFLEDINKAANTKSIVCIVDNQLGDAKRANEIIQAIKDSGTNERKNIVGCVFSSQDLFEVISKDIYFEYTSKENIANLEACLAKSAYNYYLAELKKETLEGLTTAFESVQESKGIAYFLSRKAIVEGESEYQIINDWINLISTNSHTNSENIKHLIGLSRVINSLEDANNEPEDSLQKLNTLEAFDYSINDYYLPIAAGDVFTDDNGNWYVLVGQDCDLARSVSRHPKNVLAELLPARIRPQTEFKKWANDLEKVSIYSFRKSIADNSEILQIDYKKRKYIANEVLNLSSYNADGVCKLSLSQELDDEQKKLIPLYMIDYYLSLKKFFTAVKTIKEQAKDAFDIINNPEELSKEQEPLLIRIDDFAEIDGIVEFGLRRVCRLTHTYVFYLYKLYLEYRGRQPFQTINLVRRDEISLPVYNNAVKTDYFCSVQQVEDPNESNPKNWRWIISKSEILRISGLLGFDNPECSQDDVVIEKESFETPLPSGKQLVIEKAKDKIKIYSRK